MGAREDVCRPFTLRATICVHDVSDVPGCGGYRALCLVNGIKDPLCGSRPPLGVPTLPELVAQVGAKRLHRTF